MRIRIVETVDARGSDGGDIEADTVGAENIEWDGAEVLDPADGPGVLNFARKTDTSPPEPAAGVTGPSAARGRYFFGGRGVNADGVYTAVESVGLVVGRGADVLGVGTGMRAVGASVVAGRGRGADSIRAVGAVDAEVGDSVGDSALVSTPAPARLARRVRRASWISRSIRVGSSFLSCFSLPISRAAFVSRGSISASLCLALVRSRASSSRKSRRIPSRIAVLFGEACAGGRRRMRSRLRSGASTFILGSSSPMVLGEKVVVGMCSEG